MCERLNSLPAECYPIVGLLAGSMLVFLLSRGRRAAPQTAAAQISQIATHVPGAFGLPVSMILPAMAQGSAGEQNARTRGSVFGSLAATVGLAIIAVGGMAVLRAATGQQPTLMRPGVVIAAVGQFVLLLGIVAMAARNRRAANAPDGGGLHYARAVAAQPVVASPLPYLPVNAGYAWPTPPHAAAGQGSQSGQIAQLKAQLACLSQQLDHLGDAENSGASKVA
jgi:hypothetical protein